LEVYRMKRRQFLAGLAAGAAAVLSGARLKLACPYCHSTNGVRGEGKFGTVLSGGLPVHEDSILCRDCHSVYLASAPYHPVGEVAKPTQSIYNEHAHNYGGHLVVA
jgi:hypothetical protein